MGYEINNILYATDLGPRSVEVFRHAVGLAQRFGAKLHVITVARSTADLMISEHLSREQLSKFRSESKERTRSELQARIDAFHGANLDLDAHSVVADVQVLEGDASKEILAAAKRLPAQLLVLGSHGHNPIGEMLIGSVAHKAIVKSEVPVVLVPINR